MYKLVKTALEKGGVYSHHRDKPLCCQSSGKGNRMLFADTHIKHTLGKLSLNNAQVVPLRHSRRNCHQPGTFPHQTKYRPGKYLTISGYILFSRVLGGYTMKIDSVPFGGNIAFTLGCHHMNQCRLTMVVSCPGQGCLKLMNIMSVKGPHVSEAQLFPEHSGHNKAFYPVLNLLAYPPETFSQRQAANYPPAHFLGMRITGVQPHPV
ncbi:hypothetical protein ES703_114604 [subsurface metagenome]